MAAELEPDEHVLELAVSAESHPQSQGQAVRIIHFLVNGPGATEAAAGDSQGRTEEILAVPVH